MLKSVLQAKVKIANRQAAQNLDFYPYMQNKKSPQQNMIGSLE